MGYDVQRFHGEVDEELICPICNQVLEDPRQAQPCEHAFCSICINEWMLRQSTCPVDRNPIIGSQLKPVPRILRNLLAKLNISCDNQGAGCTEVVRLESLQSHVQECEHNPKKPIQCEAGCGLVIPKDELKEHNCVRELRTLAQSQQVKMNEMQTQISENKLRLNEHKREIQLLKECIRGSRLNNPRMRELQGEMENEEVTRWVESLRPGRVTRWGGMISTPDAVLQAVIKRALIDSGCPSHIVNDLMENAHERRWPPGLSTLETRQLNRRQYENYVTKRIAGKQAVVVMYCENSHVQEDMILEPGLVMIFAHGVE